MCTVLRARGPVGGVVDLSRCVNIKKGGLGTCLELGACLRVACDWTLSGRGARRRAQPAAAHHGGHNVRLPPIPPRMSLRS
eukprot:6794977-Prymnesium_polylepis.1